MFEAYREVTPLDPGFPQRRELWRIFGYLETISVDGGSPFGRRFIARLADAVDAYR